MTEQQLSERFGGALLVSVRQAGEVLGVSASTAYRLIERGEMKTVMVGPRQRVPVAEIARLLHEGTRQGSNPTNES